MKSSNWQQFEHDVQEILGLDATICSGNQWNDQGDATDNRPPADDSFRLLVDCKYTEQKSYSIPARFMGHWVDRAMEHGKRFVLAIRFFPCGATSSREYVVLTLDDFAELYERASRIIKLDKAFCDAIDRAEEPVHPSTYTPGCPNAGSICNCTGACLPKTTDRTWAEREDWKWGR